VPPKYTYKAHQYERIALVGDPGTEFSLRVLKFELRHFGAMIEYHYVLRAGDSDTRTIASAVASSVYFEIVRLQTQLSALETELETTFRRWEELEGKY